MTPFVTFDVIRTRVPLTAALQHYGLLAGLHRRGLQLVGICPIHGGANPRQFIVNTHLNTWRCFSAKCSLYGDVIDFVSAHDRVTLPEAASHLVAWFALVDPPSPVLRIIPMTETASRPSHRAYVTEDVTEGKRQKTFWTKVGAAWPHKDGKGLTVSVSPGISISGRLVLREWSEDPSIIDGAKA